MADKEHWFWVASPNALWRTPLIWLLGPGLLALLAEWLAVSPLGFKAVIAIEFVTPIFELVAGVGVLVSPFFLFSKNTGEPHCSRFLAPSRA